MAQMPSANFFDLNMGQEGRTFPRPPVVHRRPILTRQSAQAPCAGTAKRAAAANDSGGTETRSKAIGVRALSRQSYMLS